MLRRVTLCLALLLAVVSLVTTVRIEATRKHKNSSQNQFIVHEWGTFTSVVDETGAVKLWRPLAAPSDLPDFVYGILSASRRTRSSIAVRTKDQSYATVRMETPVVYFYADRETKASVRVDFPKGRLTDWYPQSRHGDESIKWNDFTVDPGLAAGFPVEKRESRYYEARNTDAAPLRVSSNGVAQDEKFLFYRGLGVFDLPVSVRPDQGLVWANELMKDSRKDAAPGGIGKIILFENVDGRTAYQVQDLASGVAVFDRKAAGQTVDSLRGDLVKILVESGLYEKEATAMVATWGDSWFEPGLRVFYVLPRKVTDSVIPITISPKPDELVRVMLCRTEIIAPEMVDAVQHNLQTLSPNPAEARVTIARMVPEHGRFLEAILGRALDRMTGEELKNRLAVELSAAQIPTDGIISR